MRTLLISIAITLTFFIAIKIMTNSFEYRGYTFKYVIFYPSHPDTITALTYEFLSNPTPPRVYSAQGYNYINMCDPQGDTYRITNIAPMKIVPGTFRRTTR
jgi:hypothetical protein